MSASRPAHATRSNQSNTSMDANAFAPFGIFSDLPRRQAALVMHSATALLRGAMELRQLQQDAAFRTFQEATQYWQQLANTTLKLQADLMSSAGEAVVEGASEPTLESLQRAFEATWTGNGAAQATH